MQVGNRQKRRLNTSVQAPGHAGRSVVEREAVTEGKSNRKEDRLLDRYTIKAVWEEIKRVSGIRIVTTMAAWV